MRLEDLKPGMKIQVFGHGEVLEVIGVGKNRLFLRDSRGYEQGFDFHPDFVEVKPKKRPSERIGELMRPSGCIGVSAWNAWVDQSGADCNTSAIVAIVKLLDEKEREAEGK